MNLICEKSLIKQQISRCMYCSSTSYGKGCRYGPHGVHFHPDDAKKCSYCGSTSFGRGCKVNPFDDLHLHGINYNSMFKESLKNSFMIEQLNKDFKDYEAYKLGIIDENGLGSKWDLIRNTIVLESESKIGYNKENHQKFLKYENQIQNLLTQLHELTNTALGDGLSVEQVESFFH